MKPEPESKAKIVSGVVLFLVGVMLTVSGFGTGEVFVTVVGTASVLSAVLILVFKPEGCQ